MRQQATDMSALLKPILGNAGATEKMSVGFTKLATDLSSFNNVPSAQVLADIRSGVVGQTEPLMKYGIVLTAATVQAKALAESHKANAKELTAAELVHARYSLIMEKTTAAQGDAVRTSGGFANQLRALKNSATDAFTSLGTQMLPTATKGLHALNELFPRIKSSVQDAIPAIKTAWDQYGAPVFEAARTGAGLIVDYVREHWPQITSTLRDIAGVAGRVFNELYDTARTIIANIVVVFNAHKPQLLRLWTDVQSAVKITVDVIKGLADFFVTYLWPTIRPILETLIPNAFGLVFDSAEEISGAL
jgi:phage-related protein